MSKITRFLISTLNDVRTAFNAALIVIDIHRFLIALRQSRRHYTWRNIPSTCVLDILCISLRHNIHSYFDKSTTLDQRSIRIQVFRRGVCLHYYTPALHQDRLVGRNAPHSSLRYSNSVIARAKQNLTAKILYYISNILHKRDLASPPSLPPRRAS